jgi:hypothetical protein
MLSGNGHDVDQSRVLTAEIIMRNSTSAPKV